MKMYKENKGEKSWAIRLVEANDGRIQLKAVDVNNERELANLIVFYSNGKVCIPNVTQFILEDMGYNPYEHNNQWNDNGQLIVEY